MSLFRIRISSPDLSVNNGARGDVHNPLVPMFIIRRYYFIMDFNCVVSASFDRCPTLRKQTHRELSRL